ncbi:MAG: metal-dependent hydrolase [Bacteroidetes bacterium]|nr:metal-dependent hydrolase [Bacteroidota bacterium]
MDEAVYLKANFVAEPLVAGWYAWAHLISPVTGCLNIKNRHIPILKSYITDPAAHAAACEDPKMTGGPFIDLNGGMVTEIKALLSETLRLQMPLIAFATALEKLDQLLMKEAAGYSMEGLYDKVPAILKGYVELVYDLHNNPSYRIKESLIYKSKYYDRSMQSLLLYLINDDSRPFVFSTPRLANNDSLQLAIPFDHTSIDELYKMVRTPGPYEKIKQALGISPEQDAVFRQFFTTKAPDSYSKYTGTGARTRYFGHACILIETKDIAILVDPVISYGYDAEVSRFTYSDLPDVIDYVLITHNHQDHVLLETMLQLRHKVKNWVIPRNGNGLLQDPSLKLMLQHTGFNNVCVLEDLDELPFSNGSIIALPFMGEHGDLDVGCKLGYLININNYKIMCLADSQNLEFKMYEHIEKIYGSVDVLFLGMECNGAPVSWIYGPYFPEQLQRDKDLSRSIAGSDYARAIDIVNRFNIKEAYVYAMGMEPWIKFLSANIYTPECNAIVQSDKLLIDCQEKGIITERLFGEKIILQKQAVSVS